MHITPYHETTMKLNFGDRVTSKATKRIYVVHDIIGDIAELRAPWGTRRREPAWIVDMRRAALWVKG